MDPPGGFEGGGNLVVTQQVKPEQVPPLHPMFILHLLDLQVWLQPQQVRPLVFLPQQDLLEVLEPSLIFAPSGGTTTRGVLEETLATGVLQEKKSATPAGFKETLM